MSARSGLLQLDYASLRWAAPQVRRAFPAGKWNVSDPVGSGLDSLPPIMWRDGVSMRRLAPVLTDAGTVSCQWATALCSPPEERRAIPADWSRAQTSGTKAKHQLLSLHQCTSTRRSVWTSGRDRTLPCSSPTAIVKSRHWSPTASRSFASTVSTRRSDKSRL